MPTADRTPHSAAFEVGKGRQKVLTLSEQQVAQLLDPAQLLLELEKAFGALARGEIQCPPRPQIRVPGKGFSLSMAAWQPGMQDMRQDRQRIRREPGNRPAQSSCRHQSLRFEYRG